MVPIRPRPRNGPARVRVACTDEPRRPGIDLSRASPSWRAVDRTLSLESGRHSDRFIQNSGILRSRAVGAVGAADRGHFAPATDDRPEPAVGASCSATKSRANGASRRSSSRKRAASRRLRRGFRWAWRSRAGRRGRDSTGLSVREVLTWSATSRRHRVARSSNRHADFGVPRLRCSICRSSRSIPPPVRSGARRRDLRPGSRRA